MRALIERLLHKKHEGVFEEKDERPIDDHEYLFHHVLTDENGEEKLHHCFFYDHIGNMFEQQHLTVKNGKVYVDGKSVKNGVFHIIKGLEPSQEVVWSDEEAVSSKIKPKQMRAGMTLKDKSKEW